ncbi:MAG: gamma-glutamyltransferase [Bacteroidota bacterium]
MKHILILTLLIPMLRFSFAQDRISSSNYATRSEVIAVNGMAATSQPLATQVALDILKQGGTAIDAAIAANATLGLMEPTGCGIGGDLFAIVWDAKGQKLHGLNASGRSPLNMTKDYLLKHTVDGEIPSYGPLSVSVPGAVDGWYELHEKFGKLPMKVILAPAISYAKEGFPVSELIALYMAMGGQRFIDEPYFAETYMPRGHTPRKGEIFKNPRLANTLQLIADGGRKAFYKGEIAKKIVAHMKEIGGLMSMEDFKNHRSEWVEPVSTNYRGYDVWELPPNGQGIAALQMLNILEEYDLRSMGFGSAEYIHTLVEAKKLAYEDRAKFYADPAFNELPIAELISKPYADKRRKLIKNRAAKSYPAGKLKDGDTIYLTVADKEGNMVSFIQSNYKGMGSGVIPGELGFMLQDRGALFSLEEGHFNMYEPGKRPFHTIIPAFVSKDGTPFMSFGVMGGDMQPQGHVQILVNMIDFDMNLQEAGDAPRVRHAGSTDPAGPGKMQDGGSVYLESGFDDEARKKLALRGHQIRFGTSYGGYQAIMYDAKEGVYYGASESRKDGHAAGY